MGSAFSKSSSPFVSLPIELVHYILELSLEPPNGRVGQQHAQWVTWVARVARVSKSASVIATPKLYSIIQLQEDWAIVLLATTLARRPDLAHGVKALHIAPATTGSRNDLAHSMGSLFIDTRATVRRSYRQLIAMCKNAFLQIHNTAFDPHGLLAGTVPAAQRSYRRLSIACAIVESMFLDLQILHRMTHLHFGMGKGAPGWTMLFSVTALAKEWGRIPTSTITHVAFDWDPESKCCGDLFGAIASLMSEAPSTLQRIAIRFPVFTSASEPTRIGRRQDELRRILSAIDDPRVYLAFVEVPSSPAAEDRMYEMALEGWSRHAQGHEDLWMSGHPVYLV